MLELSKLSGTKKISELSVSAAREQYNKSSKERQKFIFRVGSIQEYLIRSDYHRIKARVYKPYQVAETELLPALIYFHGGGHVLGNLETHDQIARNFCTLADCIVVTIDYRLAPEHQFPAAVTDAINSLEWVIYNKGSLKIDCSRIAVGGDSAGGNLAAICALYSLKYREFKLCFQLLIYPVIDMTFSSESHQLFSSGYGILDSSTDKWFRKHYIPNQNDWRNWMASPLFAKSHNGLPRTLIVLAELDMLHDEGAEYHRVLLNANVNSRLLVYEGMIHGFISAPNILNKAMAAHVQIAAELRTTFNNS